MLNVLVLYPGTVTFRQAQVVGHRELLDALGIRLVLADDYLVDTDRAHFADVIALPPAEFVSDALAILERYAARNQVHAVLAQSEGALLIGTLIAAKLGLPCIRPEAAHLTTNKYLCRIELARAGVPQPRFVLAQSVADVRAFARESGYPLVLKGVASALGRLVTLVRGESDVDAAVARMHAGLASSVDVARVLDFARVAQLDPGCDPLRQFLVESFARGTALETDGIVAGDTIRTFGVTEQVLSAPPWFYMEGYLLPADRRPDELALVERVSDDALRALGVRDTGYSIEMRLDGSAVSLIEVNGRLGWDEGFGDLFATITGAQPALLTLQLALGQDAPFARRSDVRCALAYSSSYTDAIVKSVPTREELARIAREHEVLCGLAVHAGERMRAPPHPDAFPHVAWALARHATSSRAAFEIARDVVSRIHVELGAG